MSNQDEEFPLKNRQAACTINGHHTEIMLTGYQDKIFLVISQYGKIGTLIQTTFDIPPHLASNPTAVPTTSHVLLGESTGQQCELYCLYATSITQAVAAMNPHEKRQVLLGIALRPTESMKEQREVFNQIIDHVMANSVW